MIPDKYLNMIQDFKENEIYCQANYKSYTTFYTLVAEQKPVKCQIDILGKINFNYKGLLTQSFDLIGETEVTAALTAENKIEFTG